MNFCFGFITNDPALTVHALASFREDLMAADGAPHGWGMGYYQASQPLMKRQPKPLSEPLDFVTRAGNIRTNILLGHVGQSSPVSQRTENTAPFRFGNWLFCHAGQLETFVDIKEEVLKSIPDFIRRNIRGETVGEHIFHLYLSFLNDTGKIDNPRLPAEVVAQALTSTFTYLDRLVVDRGGTPTKSSCLLSNGELVVAYRKGIELRLARQSSFTFIDPDGRTVSPPHLKAVVMMAGKSPTSPGWEETTDNSIVAVDDELNIKYLSSTTK